MRYFIITDLEGAAGVERFNQTYGDEPFKLPAMEQLTRETSAAVSGILEADPESEITVIDGHGPGGLLKEELHPGGRYVRGRDAVRAIFTNLSRYAGCFFVGQHAMACTPNAPLCHSGSSKDIVYWRLNGVLVGEFGFWAALAGSGGVPTLFLSGDDKAVVEARGLAPHIETVTTKWGEGWQRARHLDPEESCRAIRRGARAACERRNQIPPLRFDPPFSWEVRHIHPTTPAIRDREGLSVTQLDSRTILYRSDDLLRFAF